MMTDYPYPEIPEHIAEHLRRAGMLTTSDPAQMASALKTIAQILNDTERTFKGRPLCPRCHEPLGTPINEFGDYAACSSCGYGSKKDAEISALKERVVEAAIAYRKAIVANVSPHARSEAMFADSATLEVCRETFVLAVDALIERRNESTNK